MRIKSAITLTAFGLLLVIGIPAVAQDAPPPHNWDISKIDVSKLPPASDQKDVTFDKDIAPLFKTSCVRCHGEQRPRQNLRLDSLDAVLKGGRDGKMVVPGASKASLLVAAAAQIDDKIAMPPKRRPRGGPRRRTASRRPPQPAGRLPPKTAGQVLVKAALADLLLAVRALDLAGQAAAARRQSLSRPNRSVCCALGLIKAPSKLASHERARLWLRIAQKRACIGLG